MFLLLKRSFGSGLIFISLCDEQFVNDRGAAVKLSTEVLEYVHSNVTAMSMSGGASEH